MPKKTYSALLSNGERINVEAVSGPKAIIAAKAAAPEGVGVKSVTIEVPVGTGKNWGIEPSVAELLDRTPVVCGECGQGVKHSETKIVSREIPYPKGTVIFFGMPIQEEMRVCATHEVVTNWPKRQGR